MGLQIFANCLLTLLLIFPYIRSDDQLEKFLDAAKKLADIGTLDYGDSCHYNDELKRQKIGQSVALLDISFEDFVNDFVKHTQDLLDTGRDFCNAKHLLACDQITERCHCGPKSSDTFYTREDGSCRWAEGSKCVHIVESFEETGVNAKCSSHTKCTIEGIELECTIENSSSNRNISENISPNCYCSGAGVVSLSFGLLLLSIFWL